MSDVILVPDIENIVFNTVATALRAQFPGIYVAGEAISAPPKFPAVTLVEQDNGTYERTIDNMTSENHASLMYEAQVYSNLTSGKKAQCKAIMALIDEKMLCMGFVRIGRGPMPLPNLDNSIYRMVGRYRAVVSKDMMVYHR
jgi:hypothetical protein